MFGKETFNKLPYSSIVKILQIGKKQITGNSLPVHLTINSDVTSTPTVEEIIQLTPSKIDESAEDTTYIGYSTDGIDANDTWCILKIVDDSGELTYYIPNVPVFGFNQVWDDRTTITYKVKTV